MSLLRNQEAGTPLRFLLGSLRQAPGPGRDLECPPAARLHTEPQARARTAATLACRETQKLPPQHRSEAAVRRILKNNDEVTQMTGRPRTWGAPRTFLFCFSNSPAKKSRTLPSLHTLARARVTQWSSEQSFGPAGREIACAWRKHWVTSNESREGV